MFTLTGNRRPLTAEVCMGLSFVYMRNGLKLCLHYGNFAWRLSVLTAFDGPSWMSGGSCRSSVTMPQSHPRI